MITESDHPVPEPQPFALPCRKLPATAPLEWLKAGWRDYRNAPVISLIYGAFVAVISIGISVLAFMVGRYILLLSMLLGFVFIAPLLAVGLYSVSRQLARGEQPTLGRTIYRMHRTLGNALIFALVLMVIFMVWARAGSMVHIFFPAETSSDWWLLIRFLLIGSLVGSIFAFVTFSAAAFSLPMITDKDSDMITGCVTSLNAVLRNKSAMAVWIAIIVALTALGFVTAGIGLAIVIPLLGYATYHGYLDTIDASQLQDSL